MSLLYNNGWITCTCNFRNLMCEQSGNRRQFHFSLNNSSKTIQFRQQCLDILYTHAYIIITVILYYKIMQYVRSGNMQTMTPNSKAHYTGTQQCCDIFILHFIIYTHMPIYYCFCILLLHAVRKYDQVMCYSYYTKQ